MGGAAARRAPLVLHGRGRARRDAARQLQERLERLEQRLLEIAHLLHALGHRHLQLLLRELPDLVARQYVSEDGHQREQRQPRHLHATEPRPWYAAPGRRQLGSPSFAAISVVS